MNEKRQGKGRKGTTLILLFPMDAILASLQSWQQRQG
jgi:hypothetical protein